MMAERGSPEEPFIGSLRERVERTKAERARERAATPPQARPQTPPTAEELRAQRTARARAAANAQLRTGGRWRRVFLLLALFAFTVWLVWRAGYVPSRWRFPFAG
jgi:membrane glycosyltransferase